MTTAFRVTTSQVIRQVAVTLTALIAAFLLTFGATPALAHSDLEESTPAQGESVSTLEKISLTFAEEVVPEFSKYTLTDSMGMTVTLGTPAYDVTKTSVTIPVTGELMAGEYAIGYAVLSIDGHPISGKVTFISTASGPAPTASPTSSPTQTASPAPAGDSFFTANLGYAIIGLVAGVVVVGALTIITRRRKKQ